jgi:hypothetical protein
MPVGSSCPRRILQRLPKDVEVLAFEAGCDDYGERELGRYLQPRGSAAC